METKYLAIEPDMENRQCIEKALSGSAISYFQKAPSKIVEEASRALPDLILMDVELPGRVGLEIFARLQSHPLVRDIPVIFMASSDKPKAFLPDSDCIVRTDEIDIFKKRIEAALKRSRMERSVREAVRKVTAFSSDPSGIPVDDGASELTQQEADVLQSGGLELDSEIDYEPIAAYAAQFEALLNSCLKVSEAAKKLGVSDSRVRQRLLGTPRELFGFHLANTWRLPAFQFTDEGLVPNIDKIISRLDPDIDLVSVENWFRLKHVDLEHHGESVSPIQWLEMGLDWRLLADLAEDL